MNLLQVWQFNQNSLSDVINVAKERGFDGILVKAIDGLNWMNEFDSGEDALGSLLDVAKQRDVVYNSGLRYHIWTNPLFSDHAKQGNLTGEIANLVDGLWLDVEPYGNSFWGAWRPEGAATEFMRRLRDVVPTAYVVLQPDPRPNRLAEIRPEEWMADCNAIAGQHYFTTFGSDPIEEMVYAASLSQRFGKPAYATLQTDAPVNDNMLAIIHARSNNLEGIVAYRYNHGTLDAFKFESDNDLVTVTFNRREVLASLDTLWGWKNQLNNLTAYRASQEMTDAILNVKKQLNLL